MSERSVEELVKGVQAEMGACYSRLIRLQDGEALDGDQVAAYLAGICQEVYKLAQAVDSLNGWHCGGCRGGKSMHLCEGCKRSLRERERVTLERPEMVQWTGDVQAIHDFGMGYTVSGSELVIETNLPGSSARRTVALGDWVTRFKQKDAESEYTYNTISDSMYRTHYVPKVEA